MLLITLCLALFVMLLYLIHAKLDNAEEVEKEPEDYTKCLPVDNILMDYLGKIEEPKVACKKRISDVNIGMMRHRRFRGDPRRATHGVGKKIDFLSEYFKEGAEEAEAERWWETID